MIELGKKQTLMVVKMSEHGVYLNTCLEAKERPVLLPSKEVPEDLAVGNMLEVFIYRDSEDRKIATLMEPKLVLGELAPLKVVSINHLGAFLEWGLARDLFLPFKQQVGKIKKGQTYLVGMYIDKSDRLCATMKVYDLLRTDSAYESGSEVRGTVYSIKPAFGAFVAVDNKYHGLIPTKEFYGKLGLGETVSLRIKEVKPDGKLELSMRKPIHFQMEDDVKKIMDLLESHEGYLPYHDKSSPEAIKDMFQMSKAGFKRAIGRLMKEGVIEIRPDGIKRNW